MKTLAIQHTAPRSRGLLAALTIGCLAAVVSAAGAAEPTPPREPPEWKAGVAKAPITPERNLWLAGYAGRKKPAEGKVQDLYAKALALEDAAGQRLVIVTMDLIGVPQPVRQRLAERAERELKLPPAQLLLNASHTHSGPELRSQTPTEEELRDERIRGGYEYTRQLEARLFELIAEALQRLEPARLSWSRARCGFAMNRRLPTADGYRNSPNPDGPVDHEVPVLRVEAADGALRAMLFGYACHNTCLGFYYYCGDYAGYAQEYLEAHRQDFAAMFLMGCAGDQNPYPRGSGIVPGLEDLDLAKLHGRSLAGAVEMANLVPGRPIRGPLRAAYEEVSLDYAAARPPHAYPVQVIRFGHDLTLVALGSEVVVDYALRIKRELAGEAPVWVAGYSNDYSGYMPSLRVLREGGYEAHTGWAESVEERIIQQVHTLYRRVSAEP